MSDILDEILESKRKEVKARKKSVSVDEIKKLAHQAKPLDFRDALEGDGINLIAEIKPKAPSSGPLTDLDPDQVAWVYQEESTVSCVSVLTDEPYFGMTLEDFHTVRGILTKPVLRKEFIVDPFQIYESARAGADAVLLIASVLSAERIEEFHEMVLGLGMKPLVEIHSREEYENLPFEPELLGINNRTLEGDFSTDLAVTERIAPSLPDEMTLVSESGIYTHEDIQRLHAVSNVDAVLVGTSLLQDADDPETVRERVRDLMSES
jgi:indole-3-glycerol phosphate synthase